MNKWKVGKHPLATYKLTDNSIFVLHPMDEKPIIRNFGEPLSQFQHGNVKVKKGDLSVGFIYRNVTQTLTYDDETSKNVLPKQFCDDYQLSI